MCAYDLNIYYLCSQVTPSKEINLKGGLEDTWQAQSEEHWLDLRVVSSSPILGVESTINK